MPLLGSRGGGSVRGFGRFGKILFLFFSDTFNRSTSELLGTSSDGKGVWKNVRGIWQGNGSAAVSVSLPGSNNVAVVDLDGTNITNLQVDTGTNGGSGLAFWTTDENNYYSLYPSYTSSSTSNTACTGYNQVYGTSCGSFCANCVDSSITVYACSQARMFPSDGFTYYYASSPSGCSTGSNGPAGGWPAWSNYQRGDYAGWSEYIPYRSGNVNQTTTTTTYNSIANLRKVEGGSATALVTNTYSTNTSGFSKAQSIAISTSGSTISYTLYSAANKGGSTLASGTNSPSSPVKGPGVGLFHGTSTVDQGSTLSNFSVTVTP
jgi:hypothetical protein